MKVSKIKIILSILICTLGMVVSIPTFLNMYDIKCEHKLCKVINLGLDLKGGASLLLEVDFKTYEKEQAIRNIDMLKNSLRKNDVEVTEITEQNDQLVIIAKNISDISKCKKAIRAVLPNGHTVVHDNIIAIKIDEEAKSEIKDNLIAQSIEIIRRRIDENGTKEIDIIRQSDSYILLQVPGLENPDEIKKILGKTAKLSLHLVNSVVSKDDIMSALKPGYKVLPMAAVDSLSEMPLLVLDAKAIVSGDMLTDARVQIGQNSQVMIAFNFDSIGAKLFAEATKNNVGKRLAIVLDNKVLSAPMINEPILGGSGVIQGDFSIQSANELALLLRAGALPVGITVVQESSVGPSLGADSINSGVTAALYATLLVAIFMVMFYGLFGMIANIALIVNLILLVAVMVSMDATLTLPGIAGIVLTLGMAVDANVLIYERIKEESLNGRTPLSAIETGFNAAFATILDSNITTVLAAIILYLFGNGPVKGFGITLAIGIVCSMFTAITLSRIIIAAWYNSMKPNTLPL